LKANCYLIITSHNTVMTMFVYDLVNNVTFAKDTVFAFNESDKF